MSKLSPAAPERSAESRAQLAPYVSGFGLSVGLTLAAYLMVTHHALSQWPLALALGGLAILQFVVQLFFFLHLGKESGPRERLYALLFMLLVVGIVVMGSIWIMYNLNYRMIPAGSRQVNSYMKSQADGGL